MPVVKYEIESLDDFMTKLKDLKVDEVGLRVELTGRDVSVKRIVRQNPTDAGVEQVIPAKEVSATLCLTAVAFQKGLADTYEIPISYSEQLDSNVIISSTAEGDAFAKKIDEAKKQAIATLQDGFGKKIIFAKISPTQHSHYGLGANR